MRKYHKNLILEIIQSMYQAGEQGDYAGCQDTALDLCDFIDAQQSNTETVALLTQYAEMCFKANEEEIGAKQLSRQLIKVENSVNHELAVTKIEVVFFPYNLSMWDSLESIYLAAKSDPDCDVYVVPIPYYEWTPDRKLGKEYYHGDQYPDDVEITHYRDYDITARKPDLAFIHYEYDDMANNATIAPDFYSKRLKEYCGKLIYVPYFFATPNKPDDFWYTMPGVIHADKVILPSDDHYQVALKKSNQVTYLNKAIEDKYISLGSPKLDKVLNSKETDFQLPEEWQVLMTKPDGTRKKIVLLNTHMFSLIESGFYYFIKLKKLFDLFFHQPDLVLWWRPHPNTLLNIRLKAPFLLEEYITALETVKNNKLGIVDETGDLHRALYFSDAYYGHKSTVANLFSAKGCPVMIQPVRPKEHQNFTSDFPMSLEQMSSFMNCRYLENEDVSVEAFLNYVVNIDQIQEEKERAQKQKDCLQHYYKNSDGTAGIKIYKYVKELVV